MRYVMQPKGPSFEATRVRGKYEFLASTDNWFRPVNYVNAPDGTLHVVDMYRETIEHSWSIPDDIKSHHDLVSGRDRGRIYRLIPPKYREGFKTPRQPRLGSTSIEALVAELENPSTWWRDTAHRLVFQRQDTRAVSPLRQMIRESGKPTARLHAIWSLAGLKSFTGSDIEFVLADSSPHVRRHAVRLAESRVNDSPKLLAAVLRAADDPDQRVRFQVALTLGEVQDERATSALARIARRDAEDQWMRAAMLSSLARATASFLVDLLSDEAFSASSPG